MYSEWCVNGAHNAVLYESPVSLPHPLRARRVHTVYMSQRNKVIYS